MRHRALHAPLRTPLHAPLHVCHSPRCASLATRRSPRSTPLPSPRAPALAVRRARSPRITLTLTLTRRRRGSHMAAAAQHAAHALPPLPLTRRHRGSRSRAAAAHAWPPPSPSRAAAAHAPPPLALTLTRRFRPHIQCAICTHRSFLSTGRTASFRRRAEIVSLEPPKAQRHEHGCMRIIYIYVSMCRL